MRFAPISVEPPLDSPCVREECYEEYGVRKDEEAESPRDLTPQCIGEPNFEERLKEVCRSKVQEQYRREKYDEVGTGCFARLEEVCRSKFRDQCRRKKYYEACRDIYARSEAARIARNTPGRRRFAALALGFQHAHFEELCRKKVAEQEVRKGPLGHMLIEAEHFVRGLRIQEFEQQGAGSASMPAAQTTSESPTPDRVRSRISQFVE